MGWGGGASGFVMNVASSERYAVLRVERSVPLSLREPAGFLDPVPVSERLVQAIWADQLFQTTSLCARDGRHIEVISPGHWNAEGGPDFIGAQLRIGDVEARGDVEVHLHSTGWCEHGHATDPAYGHVILDVYLWEMGDALPVQRLDGWPVPQLAVGPLLEGPLDEIAESLDLESYPFSPWRWRDAALRRLPKDPAEIRACVESAGVFRFERKAERMAAAIGESGADQAAYAALAEALGYKHNRRVFCEIAAAVPLRRLLEPSSPDERIFRLLAEADRRVLRTHQVRPANHPERRLAALALIVEEHPRLAEWMVAAGRDPHGLRRAPPLAHPFWSWHYHRRARPSRCPVALVGEGRWREIVANILLPLTYALARRDGNGEEASRILRAWMEWPSSPPNLAARQAAYELGLPPPKRTATQQGLLQMRQDWDL